MLIQERIEYAGIGSAPKRPARPQSAPAQRTKVAVPHNTFVPILRNAGGGFMAKGLAGRPWGLGHGTWRRFLLPS